VCGIFNDLERQQFKAILEISSDETPAQGKPPLSLLSLAILEILAILAGLFEGVRELAAG